MPLRHSEKCVNARWAGILREYDKLMTFAWAIISFFTIHIQGTSLTSV